jgi:exodeoxyribonuclease-3
MQLLTWNVNSIRMRLDRLRALLSKHSPDVVCLQETKVSDELFPTDALTSMGYRVESFGQRGYNGVAILSRDEMTDVVRGLPGDGPEDERRLIAARVAGVRVVCVYVPNGQSVESPRFAGKLEWLRRLRAFLDAHAAPGDPVVVAGDFNVAPEDRDVHDPELWRGKIHFHPLEHEALAGVRAWGLDDLFRLHVSEAGHHTWWDYRQLAFPKKRGLRIDLIYGSRSMGARCTACAILRDERKGPKPSDHAPVVATFGA